MRFTRPGYAVETSRCCVNDEFSLLKILENLLLQRDVFLRTKQKGVHQEASSLAALKRKLKILFFNSLNSWESVLRF